jgi:hypothetical protein
VLASTLGEDARVDRFAVGAEGRDERPAGAGCYPARALGQAFDPWGYDAVVYAVDRRPPPELVEIAARYPGIVWFTEQPDDPELMAEMARSARGAVVAAELGRLSVGAGAFGRSLPTTVAPADDAAQVRALVERLNRSTG